MINIDLLAFERDDFHFSIKKLHVDQNEKIAILGENGSGKSTLFYLLAGLLKDSKGSIKYNKIPLGKIPILERARLFSFLPQYSYIIFPFTVMEIVLLGALWENYNFKMEISKNEMYDIDAMLQTLDIYNIKDKKWTELSGGEKRRVMIARVLNQNTDIIYFDEPTNMLDIRHSLKILCYILSLNKTIIASIHDINLAYKYFDRFILLKKGKILADIKREGLNEKIINEGFDVKTCLNDGTFSFDI